MARPVRRVATENLHFCQKIFGRYHFDRITIDIPSDRRSRERRSDRAFPVSTLNIIALVTDRSVRFCVFSLLHWFDRYE